eukprot:141210_1
MSVQTIKLNVCSSKVYSSGIHVECMYIIDRFLLAMTLVYDLNHRTISIKRIGIDAQLLIDKKNDDADILLILVHWDEHIKQPLGGFGFWRQSLDIDIDTWVIPRMSCRPKVHEKAQSMSHINFDESVELYGDLLQSLSQEEKIEIIHKDIHHFGEPFVSIYLLHYDIDSAIQTDRSCTQPVSKISIEIINHPKLMVVDMPGFSNSLDANVVIYGNHKERNHKRLLRFKKRRHKWMQGRIACNFKQEKKLSKKKLHRTKKASYHRW